jgi:hypothetical protein
MASLILSPEETLLVKNYRAGCIEKSKKRFLRKRLNHENNERLKNLLDGLTVPVSDKLYLVKFRCYFSLYLYLLLKEQAVKITLGGENFLISFGVEINFLRTSSKYCVSRNTVKRAFRELKKIGLIFSVRGMKSNRHKSVRTCLIFNDNKIGYFDEKKRKVMYTMN